MSVKFYWLVIGPRIDENASNLLEASEDAIISSTSTLEFDPFVEVFSSMFCWN